MNNDRRQFIRGTGAALALPFLESWTPKLNAAGRSDAGPPKRFVTLYMPNGVFPGHWDVKESKGKVVEFSKILKPIEPFRDDFSLIAGLDNSHAALHVGMTSAFLSGYPRAESKGQPLAATASIDQLIANQIGNDTKLRSMVLGTEPPRSSKAVACSVSWSSARSLVAPELNPQTVFDRMFRTFDTPEAKANARRRRSVLDLAMADAKQLDHKISHADRHKLNEYLTGVREVERRITIALNPSASDGKWKPSHRPELIRPVGGIPRDRQLHMDLQIDMIALALQTDTSRVCTLMMGHGSSRKGFSFLDGITDDHHTMSHHKGAKNKVDQYTAVSRWHIQKLARLLKKMQAIDEGGSSLLDNSLVLFGSSMKDGNAHNKEDMPIVLAGKAGGDVTPGRIIRQPKGTPHSNLLVSLMNVMGVKIDSIGPSTGRVEGL